MNLQHDIGDHLYRRLARAAAERGEIAGQHAGDGEPAERFHAGGDHRVFRVGDIDGNDAALAERQVNDTAVDVDVVDVALAGHPRHHPRRRRVADVDDDQAAVAGGKVGVIAVEHDARRRDIERADDRQPVAGAVFHQVKATAARGSRVEQPVAGDIIIAGHQRDQLRRAGGGRRQRDIERVTRARQR